MIKLKDILIEGGGCCTRPKNPLSEMPKMKTQFTLADDWKTKAQQFQQDYAGKRGEGFSNLMSGLEKLDNLDHELITTGDLVNAWGFKGNFNLNRDFKPALLRAGILIPLKGDLPTQQVDIDIDDEWSVSNVPDSELTQAIDKDLAFRKIKVDPKAKKVEITQIKKYKVKIDAEKQDNYSTLYLIKRKSFTTSVFKFLKPYVENKYSQKVPEGIELKLDRSWNTKDRSITDLFPNQGDFVKYMKENLPKWNSSQQLPLMVYKQVGRDWEQQTRLEWFKKYEGIEKISVDKVPYEIIYEIKVTR